MVSFKDLMKARFDRKQLKFQKNGSVNLNETVRVLSDIYLCPFCLYKDKFGNFLPSDRINLIVCPECDNSMLKETLFNEMTIEQFANWVYKYSFSGFWKKCSFKIFNQRLKDMGLATKFWDRYKELRGEYEEE